MSRPSIEISEKLFERLTRESVSTGSTVDEIAEQALVRFLSAMQTGTGKKLTILFCVRCNAWHPHNYDSTRSCNVRDSSGQAGPANEQIYSCSRCSFKRRYGLLSINGAIEE